MRGSLSKATAATLLSALGLDSNVDGYVPPLPEGSQIPLGKTDAYEALTESVHLDHLKLEEYVDYVKAGRLVARELGLAPGQSALVVNGRVSAPWSLTRFISINLNLKTRSLVRLRQATSVLRILRRWKIMNTESGWNLLKRH
jgi:UDP-glucose:glycoprotein glucosyltransferase